MKKIYFVCITALLFLASCAKEDPNAEKGCTDPLATNYDPNAIEDCCCSYKGKVVFWYDQSVSQREQAKASYNLTFYVGETKPTEKIGTFPSSRFWNGVPICGTDGTITIERNLGTSKTKSFAYLVTDEVGNRIWEGTHTWKATKPNECTSLQLK